METTLAPHELYLATNTGVTRAFLATSRDSREGLKKDVSWTDNIKVHIQGAVGEVGVAKLLSIFSGFPIDTYKTSPDLQKGNLYIEVRTRSAPWHELIVREDDKDTSAYILAVYDGGDTVSVKGWIMGWKAKDKKYLANHGFYGDAYFVPQDALESIEELEKILANKNLLESIVND